MLSPLLLSVLRMFQSTHPRGVRHALQKVGRGRGAFQSTHPRGVRPIIIGIGLAFNPVSIHAPAWGATFPFKTAFIPRLFQSTHPRGVRLADHRNGGATGEFQSTHPRGVRRVRPFSSLQYFRVSIHAPAWGATIWPSVMTTLCTGFQSTHPRGVRHVVAVHQDVRHVVSIHAPAWGATTSTSWRRPWMPGFQSTHPRGVRLEWQVDQVLDAWFQSTHPRGVRRGIRGAGAARVQVSIHAPAWGATNQTITDGSTLTEFQSTHPRGVRQFPCFIQ